MRVILWDFEMQKYHSSHIEYKISSQITRRKENLVNFAVPANHSIKMKEHEKMDKYLGLAWELNKLRNMMVTMIIIIVGVFRTVPKGLKKNKRNNLGNSDYSTIKISLNTLNSSRDARRLFVTQTSLNNHPLKLLWKTRTENNYKQSYKRDKYLGCLPREILGTILEGNQWIT